MANSPVIRVKSQDLKKYLATSRKPTKVVGEIERHMLTRPLESDRRQDVLHPSEIVKKDWCLRESYFRIIDAQKGVQPRPERPSLRLQSIFDVGHAVHEKWQGYLAEMGNLWGSWECRECGSRPVDPGPIPGACSVCGRVNWKYNELHLFSDQHLISGSTDGWIIGLGPDALLEIKSIGTGTIRAYDSDLLSAHDGNLEKAFEDIRMPFIDHRRQGQTYLRLTHLMREAGKLDREPPDEIVFLYECKSNQAYREFAVKYDPGLVDDVFEDAEIVAGAVLEKKAPACNIGGTSGCHKCAPYKGRK